MIMMNRRQLARLLFLFPHAKKLFVGRCSTTLSDCMQTAHAEKASWLTGNDHPHLFHKKSTQFL